MKFLLLSLALVALAVAQTCDLDRSWSNYQTGSSFQGGLWEEYELIGWGMDGGNKWNDFWLRTTSSSTRSHYSRVTCATTYQGALPAYVSTCGDCSLTSSAGCDCYPYYDVAESYQNYPGPSSESEPPVAPEGWPSSYEAGNPPFESFPSADGSGAWTQENCQQYKPAYVYYYTYKLRLQSDGDFQKSAGISKAFIPSDESWSDFCDLVFNNDDVCYVPSLNGGDVIKGSLFGAEYQYQSGEWRDNDSNDVQFYHNRFENGCHMKALDHRFPSANYCGDDAGWRFGAGTTAHVRFGCDVGTFYDTETDQGRDIDDGDCSSVYVAFDQVSPLENLADTYEVEQTTRFSAAASLVRGDNDCWYESSFTDHRSDIPNYRTPCSAGVLAVPFVALVSTILMVLRNMF